MFKKIATLAAFAAISLCFSVTAQAQFGGVQVRIGGYGPGAQLGGYGNGYNGYGNSYSYGNGYQANYGTFAQPSAMYLNGGNFGGFSYSSYPAITYGFGSPRYYATPARRYIGRRFR